MENKKTGNRKRCTEDKVLDAIIKYIEEHQYPPTVREIGDIVGLRSTSSVQAYLNRLFMEGKLETDAPPGTPRAIRVPGYQYSKQ